MPSHLAKRKFCSRKCAGAAGAAVARGKRKTEWVKITCKQCGEEFEVTPAWARNGRRKFCSRECHKKGNYRPNRTGKRHKDSSRKKMADAATGKFLRENSSQWRGGRYYSKAGYVYVMVDILTPEEQAFARLMLARKKNQKYILEHRVNAAVKLGRSILDSEVVHHLNGIKDDNRPENLVVQSRKGHSQAHRETERELRRLRERVKELEAENSSLRSKLVSSEG
jgi:hypothetical protein